MILTIFIAVLIVVLAYYVTLRITRDSTFAFLVGIVAAVIILAYKGILG